jgi:hypothetical protein
MEDQLWRALYRLIESEDNRRPRPKGVQFTDGAILAVACWAILHDRPICWACRRRNWPASFTRDLPSPATMSRRLRTLSLWLLLEQVFYRLLAVTAATELCLCRRVDSKPLAVGGYSKDRDARRGYATGGMCKGYKIFGCWCKQSIVPEAVVLGAMNESDPAGTTHLIDRIGQLHAGGPVGAGGYVLGDSTDDTNALHEHLGLRGFQLLAPRRISNRGGGLGTHGHSPYRLRCIELLEGPGEFGRSVYRLRGQVERDYGNLGSFGGGLQPLPNFVRRPRRVALWVLVKLIINGIRISQKQGLALQMKNVGLH